MAHSLPTFKLNNGISIPALGFGTFAKEGVPGVTHDAVVNALEVGYRHLDCAWYYLNEDEVRYFHHYKVWPHLSEQPEDVEWSLNNSLEMLGTDYVDCFLVHYSWALVRRFPNLITDCENVKWPFSAEKTADRRVKLGPDGKYMIKTILSDNPELTWRALEKLHRAGKTRSIGVSNWTIPGLKILLKCAEIKPSINQIEIHPFLPNTELIDYCRSQGILPVAYSPLGSQEQAPTSHEKVLTNVELNALALKKGVTLAQILIAWGIKRGYAVLPKSADLERIRSNFQLIDLSEEDFAAVNKVAGGRNSRFVNPRFFGYEVWDSG